MRCKVTGRLLLVEFEPTGKTYLLILRQKFSRGSVLNERYFPSSIGKTF